MAIVQDALLEGLILFLEQMRQGLHAQEELQVGTQKLDHQAIGRGLRALLLTPKSGHALLQVIAHSHKVLRI